MRHHQPCGSRGLGGSACEPVTGLLEVHQTLGSCRGTKLAMMNIFQKLIIEDD